MSTRDFSNTVKLEVLKVNLEQNKGKICCEACGKSLSTIQECHFDHIYPFAKGGKSSFDNCQLLCSDCNLKKHDKELQPFLLEETAKRFLNGETLNDCQAAPAENCSESAAEAMTKEEFDRRIADFIREKGNLYTVDFRREYNKLPPIHYVQRYYGDLNALKKAFGIEDLSGYWTRETIREALCSFVSQNGTLSQKDLVKANRLPSLPCILNYYPEYQNFTDVKKGLCQLSVPIRWTKELAVEYGKTFVRKNGTITQKDLKACNHLPTAKVIDRLFGSLGEYQKAVGAEVSVRNEFVSKEKITVAVDRYFDRNDRVIESKKVFLEAFAYSHSTILARYGTFEAFCKEQGITVLFTKKANYSKREVDDSISKWVKEGNDIPAGKDLAKFGLPSREVIRKYYENWKEPFYLYQKLLEEWNRSESV